MTATTMTVEEFKVTELGPLPPEWEVVRLGDVAKVASGGSAPQGKEFFDGQNPFVRVQHLELESDTIRRWDLITDEAVNKCGLRLYSKGTIVFPKSGASIYLEKRAILPIDAYIVSHLCAVISRSPLVDQNFLFYYLRFVRLSEQKAEGYPTLNLTEIRERRIACPPLPEQRAIAYVLSSVQTAIEKAEAVIKAARELKKSLMKYVFTYGPVSIDQVENVPPKETEIGMVPEGWEVVRLEKLGFEISDGNYAANYPKRDDFVPIGIPFIRANNMIDGQIVWNDMKFITAHKHRLLRKGHLKKDDVLITTRGELGKVAFVSDEFIDANINAQIVRINTLNLANARFLFQGLQTASVQAQIKSLSTGTTLAQLPIGKLGKMLLVIPPCVQQQQIVAILSAVDRKRQVEENKKRALEALFKTLLSKLMAGKIRVDNLEVPV